MAIATCQLDNAGISKGLVSVTVKPVGQPWLLNCRLSRSDRF